MILQISEVRPLPKSCHILGSCAKHAGKSFCGVRLNPILIEIML